MTLCAKCKKNPAVFFITKMENGKTTSEGLCLSCAKELGIAPINQMIDNFGVSDEELENINNQMSEFMESMEGMPGMDGDLSEMLGQISGGEDDEGGAATAPLDAFKYSVGTSIRFAICPGVIPSALKRLQTNCIFSPTSTMCLSGS